MSNSNSPRLPKTVVHGRPVGEITQDDIEQRASEIAEIEGRGTVEADNRQQATDEMEGRSLPDATTEDDQSVGSLSRDPSDPPAFYGKAAPNFSEPNEQEELEHLVLDGVEEAQHDQMLEARKRRET